MDAKRKRQRWYRHLLQCSLQDLIVIYLPYMTLVAGFFIGACYVYDPTLRLLLYSALPGRYQNWLTFVMCLVEEMRLLLIFYGVGVPVTQSQVLSFNMVSTHLETITSLGLTGYVCAKIV